MSEFDRVEAIKVIKQAIGMGPVNDAPEPYRNHYVATTTDLLQAMDDEGLLVVGQSADPEAGRQYSVYHVTLAGLDFAGIPMPPAERGRQQEVVTIGMRRVPTFDKIDKIDK